MIAFFVDLAGMGVSVIDALVCGRADRRAREARATYNAWIKYGDRLVEMRGDRPVILRETSIPKAGRAT